MQYWRLGIEEMGRRETEKSTHEICYDLYYVL